MRVPHPSVLRVRVVLRCATLCGVISDEAISTSSLSAATGAARFLERGARDCFVRILDEVRSRHASKLIGYVVMPEHVHLLISEPRRGNPSRVLQVLKQKVSRALRKGRRKPPPGQLSLTFARSPAGEPAFWQRRFYDFNVWSEKKVREKLEYMHRNPVARKLVEHPKDWPWSSYSHYAKCEEGLIQIDSVDQGKSGGEQRK